MNKYPSRTSISPELQLKTRWLQTHKEIHAWLNHYDIKDYCISPVDNTVEVEGDVCLGSQGLTHIPIKFSAISGSLEIQNNLLTTLEFCPPKVGLTLFAQDNCLTSLDFCPEVGSNLYIQNNKIVSLLGAPQSILHNFYCDKNPLLSLVGAPKKVGAIFNCCQTPIVNFEGVPDFIGSDFRCSQTQVSIENLEFIPSYVGGKISIDTSQKALTYEELKRYHTDFLVRLEKEKLNKILDHNSPQKTNNEIKEKMKI